MKKIQLTSKKKLIIAGIIIVVVVAGGVFAFSRTRNSDQPLPTSADQPANTVNLNPPTEQEQSEANQRKDAIVEEQNNQPSPGTKKQVVPVITNARQTGVNSYVSGVFEDGGTCTATYTQGSSKFTKTSNGFADATTTSCAPINTSRSDFPSAGEWLVTMTYSSTAAEGTSAAKAFTVQ